MALEGISIHTVDGLSIGDLSCGFLQSVSWGRERSEVSRCSFASAAVSDPVLAELAPWAHWATVWEDGKSVWTGPIQKITYSGSQVKVEARDCSTLMWRTRVPLTRNYTSTDPTVIAAQLWTMMLELHRVPVDPHVNPTVGGSSFDYSVSLDSKMLNSTMDDLVKLGLDWTVVAGRPVLGSMPDAPVALLEDCDFLTDLQRVRDGSNTANDVRLQGANYATTVKVPLADLHLQTLVSLDSMYGVSNVTSACREYAKRVASINDTLTVPSGASLHPDAPVDVQDLVPGNRFVVYAADISATMRLDAMQVSDAGGSRSVEVTLETEIEPTELETADGVSISAGVK